MASQKKKPLGAFINLGGVPVDLTSGMIEAITNPPPGFTSRHTFCVTDVRQRIRSTKWFVHCGKPLSLDLTMPVHQTGNWHDAVRHCKSPEWEFAELEAQNQLTLWLHNNQPEEYEHWNQLVEEHKNNFLTPLLQQTIAPIQVRMDLPSCVIDSVSWDLLGALMENSYLSTGHRAYFFLELLQVYEAGHFPCGWEGGWPEGRLVVY